MPVYIKDPAATLDYSFDWSAWLGTDTIATATVTAGTGLTVDSTSHDDTSVTAWLSGGDAEQTYTVTCQVTTAGGRTDERSVTVRVRER